MQHFLAGSGLGPILVRAAAGSAGLRLLGMAFGFLVGVQLARGLGVEGYGVYGVAMSINAFLAVIPEFGLTQLVTREVASAHALSDWGRLRGVLRWSNRTALLLSVGVALSVVAWLGVIGTPDPRLAACLLVSLALMPLSTLSRIQSAALRGLQYIVAGQVPDELLRPAMFSLLLFVASWLLHRDLTPASAMGIQAVATACGLATAKILLERRIPNPVRDAVPSINPAAWRSAAFPMALTEGARIVQGHLVILVLGALTASDVVGIYRVASAIYVLVLMPVSLLTVVLMPILSKLHAENDRVRMQRLLGWAALGMALGVFVLSLPFMVGGERLLGWVFGAEFAGAAVTLRVLCAGAIASAAFGATGALLMMTGQEKRVSRAFLTSVAMLVLLLPPCAWLGGAFGAAWATVASLITWNAMMWRDALRLLDLDTSVIAFLGRRRAGRT